MARRLQAQDLYPNRMQLLEHPQPAVLAAERSTAQRGTTQAWIEAVPGVPYFQTEHGEPWTPVGQNDAINWPDLIGLMGRRELPKVRDYLAMCAGSGVTVLRVMLEYCQQRRWHLETPAGQFRKPIVQLWDDLFEMCQSYGLRLLLTPLDTYWMWRKWRYHPYNSTNGGPCTNIRQLMLQPDTRKRLFDRFAFATDRWGGTGTLFAWDLWNELNPVYADGNIQQMYEWVTETSAELRALEQRLHGRSHLQVVSIFSPTISEHPELLQAYQHTGVDFASIHLYEHPTIAKPKNTVVPAVAVGRMIREALDLVPDGRPFLDSEHGPIYTFVNQRRMLPEAFDDEMFRYCQWAHLASGGTGGGMRWPYRTPHSLTSGMRQAQHALASFLPLVDWRCFRRRNWNEELGLSDTKRFHGFACGDGRQAVVYVLRKQWFTSEGQLADDTQPLNLAVTLPELDAGTYRITEFDTEAGIPTASWLHKQAAKGPATLQLTDIIRDQALAVVPVPSDC